MKQILLLALALWMFSFRVNAQTQSGIPVERKNQLNTILNLIKNDHILQLAELVQYPVKRYNPLPDIKNKESFIFYYSVLFDDKFKQRLLNTDNYLVDRDDNLGLLSGNFWINKYGKIISISYQSEKELLLHATLTKEIKSLMHESVNKWRENILVAESDKFIIRLDVLADHTLRYASWSKPKNISEKPDLVLFKGEREFEGTDGPEVFAFKNSDWIYRLSRSGTCSGYEDCGLFLKVLLNDQEKIKIELNEIK